MNRLLVIKEENHTVNPDMGLVIPVAYLDENGNYEKIDPSDFPKEGANKQVISSQADSLIKISRIWADFFPANTSNQPI
ncbi:TPA: hypothetical protein RRJ50_004958 [Klebsiella pneumoniae]|nr:hypothetical protein [Klebsiella pneumoniae]